MFFSVIEQNKDAELLVQGLTTLTKMGINKYHYDRGEILASQFSCGEDYNELNQSTKQSILAYCAEKAGFNPDMVKTKKGLLKAFSNPTFEWEYFAIQTEALNNVNADNEVEDVMIAAQISTIGLGDSKTFEIDSKSLYDVQENSYGNNVSRFQQQFKSSITLTPTPKIARIDFDVTQMATIGYDFGKEMAKIAMSFRTKMYVDIVTALYDATSHPTPFVEATFAKTPYMELADRVSATNGSVGVTAFGTRVAFGKMSDTVDSGFNTLDELNRNGFIGNLYNVRSVLFDQSVNSNTADYEFRVPNDKVILLSSASDRPIKMVREGNIEVDLKDGRNSSLSRRVYTYKDSWTVGVATQAIFGIQSV